LLLREGKISPVVARRSDLGEARAGQELLAHEAFPGKIVLTPAN